MSTENILLGIDIGTTTSKGTLVTTSGKIIAENSIEHRVSRPYPNWAEHDAESVWWGDFVKICRALLQQSGVQPEQIAAVCASALYPAILPLDHNGRPLRPAILYGIDSRSIEEIEYFRRVLGDDYCERVSGKPLTTQSIGPKILWLKNNEPDIFKKAKKFINASCYLTYKLTENLWIDHGSASLGGSPYRVDGLGWDEKACEVCGITPDNLPKLAYVSDLAGYVTKQAAQETGLKEGTPVSVGTGDYCADQITLVGDRKDEVVFTYGTCIGVAKNSIEGLYLFPWQERPIGKKDILLGGGISNGCCIINWYNENFICQEGCPDKFQSIAELNLASEAIPAGSKGLILLPYLNGERTPFSDPLAKGMIFGLTLNHRREHIYHAILEGIAYAIRHTLEVLFDDYLKSISEAITVGGGTKNSLFVQTVSDVTGLTQKVYQQYNGSTLGDALFAGLTSGLIKSPAEINKWINISRVVEPNEKNLPVYNKYYNLYKDMYKKTKDDMHYLSEINN